MGVESEFSDRFGYSLALAKPNNTNNVGYRWRCMTCKEKDTVKVYEGETGRSARLRGAEHLRQLENKSEFPLALIGVLAPGSAHARPPIDTKVSK